mmetsp:Transcript_28743/g.72182  ORF Transcript_28743/g.72182 Transcript_28743/m.72182 type:complete len:528 (-) Transcript_28743:281-1864(-)|eukprot:CAMPEP_0115230580 /NCGR_PEP_ID=MMETSP0270-20121206/32789_1 /TAXON_ID=71861 /ORGANISM="Scrippsiella trochoidea, Strain CCMP3099" /LENGTH=527 /DNA_ID=CAMNT_0002645177 /DNA_START=16 /DNA_END=1599 /DNA_ORIENTATION=-
MTRIVWHASAFVFLLTVARVVASEEEDDHAHHDDGDHSDHAHEGLWEWAGVVGLVAGETYTWTATRGTSGAYADASMKIVAIKPSGRRLRRLSATLEDMLHDAEEHAEEFFEMAEANWTNVTSGSTVQISDELAFKMEFDEHTWMSLFHLQVATSGPVVFFAEHLPWEFENGFHFLKNEHGDDVETLHQEPDIDHEEEEEENAAGSTTDVSTGKNGSLGIAILAALVTALPGCFMIALVPIFMKTMQETHFPMIFAFASGAIFSCAVFLVLSEGLHMAGAGQDEVTGTWTWGVAIMVGWLTGMVIHHASEIAFKSSIEEAEASPSGDNTSMEADQKVAEVVPIGTKFAVAGPVLLGDFFHNFVDGLVIGFACRACSSSMLWTMAGVTVAHEVPQELADFFLLVTKAGMSWPWALLTNSFTAISAVIMGSIIAYEVDVSANFEGIALAYGGGVYLFIALTELSESLLHPQKKQSLKASLLCLLTFVVGATCIGLVLLDHQHCSVPVVVVTEDGEVVVEEDPHAGHNHR